MIFKASPKPKLSELEPNHLHYAKEAITGYQRGQDMTPLPRHISQNSFTNIALPRRFHLENLSL
jgi:hypothetical protein